METLNTLLAYGGRAFTAVWSKVKAVANHVVDPPPGALKFYFFAWLVSCALGIVIWNKGWEWADRKLASAVGLSFMSAHVPELPKPDLSKPDPMPGVRVELPKPLPVPPKVEEPKPNEPAEKAVPAKAPKMAKQKRKAKKTVEASDPWKF